MSKAPLVLKKFVKSYFGSSFPTEVESTDGEHWVLKMRGSGNGAKSLLVEYLVNGLTSRAGLPVPKVSVLEIPSGFPWEFGTDEFDDILQRSFGPNLAIALIKNARTMPEMELPRQSEEFLTALVTLDSFFRNFDRTQSSLNILLGENLQPWIVDHGSCLFLDTTSAPNNLSLPPNHCFKPTEGRYFSLDLLNKIVNDLAVDETVEGVPGPWLEEVGISAEQVREIIFARRDLYLANLMIRF
jgi:hypothetical protein